MYPFAKCSTKLYSLLLVYFTCFGLIRALKSDINCLKSIKDSLEDPLDYLETWDFSNETEGFICRFTGVDCWNPDENRVLNIHLSDMQLKGQFPRGLEYCSSLTGLDLSGNHINGSIPSNISRILPFITTLDLSSNQLSGEIPSKMANCVYLNVIKLDNNRLTGQIPPEFESLQRLRSFNVAHNHLTGPVPHFRFNISADSYAGNPGLCGAPLDLCKNPPPPKYNQHRY